MQPNATKCILRTKREIPPAQFNTCAPAQNEARTQPIFLATWLNGCLAFRSYTTNSFVQNKVGYRKQNGDASKKRTTPGLEAGQPHAGGHPREA
jgi:hypothetical protein